MTNRRNATRLAKLETVPTGLCATFANATADFCAAYFLDVCARLGLPQPADARRLSVDEWQAIAESQQNGLLKAPQYADTAHGGD